MFDFHQNLAALIEQAGYRKTEFSKKIGKNPNYISNLIMTGSHPSLPIARNMSAALGVPIDELAGIGGSLRATSNPKDNGKLGQTTVDLINQQLTNVQKQITSEGSFPKFDDLIEWWWAHGGRLRDMDQFQEFVDVYHVPGPNSSRLQSFKMGPRSAAAETFGIESTEQLNSELDKLSKPVALSLANAQRKTHETNQPLWTVEEIVLQTPNGKLNIAYQRLYLPVSDNSSRNYIVNASKRLT